MSSGVAGHNTRRSRVIVFTPVEPSLLLYSLSLQSVQGRTPACGNRSFPHQKGGCEGHPYSLAYFPLCFVVVRRSLGHALNVRSLLHAFHASPTEKYTALTHIRAYTRNSTFAYQPQATRRREPPPMPFAYHCLLRRSRYHSVGENDGVGVFVSSAATMSAVYSLSGKACKERGRGAYIKYVSGNATTHNTAWQRIGKRAARMPSYLASHIG